VSYYICNQRTFVFFQLCHFWGGWMPPRQHNCLGSIPGQVTWNLQWAKWCWGRFSLRTSVSLTFLTPSTVPYSLIILSQMLYSLDTDSVVKYRKRRNLFSSTFIVTFFSSSFPPAPSTAYSLSSQFSFSNCWPIHFFIQHLEVISWSIWFFDIDIDIYFHPFLLHSNTWIHHLIHYN
jgi:hypothetical protein